MRLLEAFPPPAGTPLARCPHKEVLASIADMLEPPKNDVERTGMTTTSYVTSFRPDETTVVKVRRADVPPGTFMEAVDDYITLAKLVGTGFQKRPGDLADVRYGAVSAFQVEYQNLYREPVMTGLFRDFVERVGRSDYALTLAQATRDWSPEDRQGLKDALAAVRDRAGNDEAWRCVRLAMETRRPGEDIRDLAVDIDRTWSGATGQSTRLHDEFPGVPWPKLESLMLAAAEKRPTGEAPSAEFQRLLEGYYLTGRTEGLAPLVEALRTAFPAEGVPPALRQKVTDQFFESVKARRRQGLEPQTAIQRSLEDCRILVNPSPVETPGTIRRDGERVQIGGISLEVRRRQ